MIVYKNDCHAVCVFYANERRGVVAENAAVHIFPERNNVYCRNVDTKLGPMPTNKIVEKTKKKKKKNTHTNNNIAVTKTTIKYNYIADNSYNEISAKYPRRPPDYILLQTCVITVLVHASLTRI